MNNQQTDLKQLKKVEELYETLPENSKDKFLQKYGLIHISNIDINDYVYNQEEKKSWDYIFQLSDEELKKYFRKIEKQLENGKVFVLKIDSNGKLEDRHYSTQCVYNVISSVAFEDFLILARDENVQYSYDQFLQTIQKGFCGADTYDLDHTLTKALLPKLFKHFEEHTHGYPSFLTNEQWHKILKEIIWGLDILANESDYNTPSPNTEEYKKFSKRYNRAFKLLGKYFPNLWD